MKKLLVPLLALLVILVAIGCDSDSQADEKNVLVIAQPTDVQTFDPQNAFHTHTDTILSNIFSHLYEREADNSLVPDVAESIENINDTTWLVKLKSGVTFHNGDPLTSEDVKFTFERVATDDTLVVHSYFRPIAEVRVIDDLTCEIITDDPMPTLKIMTAFSGSWILPKDYIETHGWDEFLKKPIGSGPYEFVEWVRDDRVVLKPYENYFQGKVTEWDEVVFRVIPESSTRVGELLTGGVDIALDVPPNEWARVKDNDSVSLIYGDTSYVPILILRLTEGWPTADPLLREAIEYAIDRDKIADVLYQGAAVPTRTRMTPGCFGSQTELYGKNLYDPDHARELIAQSSYNGEELIFDAGRGRFVLDSELAEMIYGMLTEVGLNVKLEITDWSAFVDRYLSKSNRDIMLIGLGDSLYDSSDSLLHYTIERAEGMTDYVNEETDSLFFAAGKNLNEVEREAQYQRIQEIVAEDRPHIPLVQLKTIYGVSNDIEFEPFLNERIKVKSITRK